MGYIDELKERRDQLKAEKSRLESELEPINKECKAIEDLLKVIDKNNSTDTYVSTPEDYPNSQGLKHKILYVLKHKGKSTSSEICKHIEQLEGTDLSKNYLSVTLSEMSKSTDIKIVGHQGNSNIYSL